jgi:hypothetical protein
MLDDRTPSRLISYIRHRLDEIATGASELLNCQHVKSIFYFKIIIFFKILFLISTHQNNIKTLKKIKTKK